MKTINFFIVFLLVISSILSVYNNVLYSEFLITWDDDEYVLSNPHLQLESWSDISDLFSVTHEGNYHPLTLLSLAADYKIWGLNPKGYHLTNLLIHAFNSFLVLFLFLLMLKEKFNTKEFFQNSHNHLFLALFGSMVFALHPMHVESVAWIAERKDVLFLFFLLLGLISYLKNHQHRQNRYYVLSLILFILAFLSKPTAVVFPLLLICIDLWKKKELTQKMIFNKLPFFLFACCFSLITIYAQNDAQAIAELSNYSTWQRIQMVCYSWCTYLIKYILPINQSGFYSYPPYEDPFPITMQLAPFIAFTLALATIWCYKRYNAIMLGILFFTISLLPVLQIIPVGSALIAERYTYLPYLGLTLASMMVLKPYVDQLNRLVLSTFILVIVLLGLQAADRTAVWQSDDTFWTDVIRKDPDSQMGHFGLGNHYFLQQDYDSCADQYERLLSFFPDNLEANSFLGYLYNKLDQPAKAIKYLDIAVMINEADIANRYQRGIALQRLGLHEDAIADFDYCVTMESDNPDYQIRRAEIYLALNKKTLAYEDWKNAVKLGTTDPKVYYNLGLYYLENQAFQDAKTYFSIAVELNPEKENYKQMVEVLENISG